MIQYSSSQQADILVIDDSPDELRLLSNFLKDQGYHVRQALDGEMALLAIQTMLPDLILLETSLPRLNGDELCRLLKNDEKTQAIPLIFFGTLNEVAERIRLFKLGGADYLLKPYCLEEILVRVEDQLRIKKRWDSLNQKINYLQQQVGTQEILNPTTQQNNQELELLKSAISATHNGIVITDASHPNHPLIYVNQGFEEMTGYTSAEILGANCRFLQGNDRDQEGIEIMRIAIQEQKECCVIVRNYRKNGSLFWNEISISPIFAQHGDLTYFIGVLTDVTERKRADEELERVQSSLRQMNRELYNLNNKLHRLANLDGLTGVANRRCFDEYFEQEWHRLIQEQSPLSLVIADIDFFKLYNDTYLHLKGDDCLKTVAQTINSYVHRSTDLVARSGGEEFAILLPNTPIEGAIKVAEMIRKKIHQLQIPHQKSSVSEYVTLSLGVATLIPTENVALTSLMAAADQALYLAKKQGRNCVIAASA